MQRRSERGEGLARDLAIGLPRQQEFVRASAQLYKTAYLDTIDNIFKIARAIEILNRRYRGSGSPEVTDAVEKGLEEPSEQ